MLLSLTRRTFLASPLAVLIPRTPNTEYRFHHDHVMGTSLDLVLYAPPARDAEANVAHAAIFSEIDRLSKILSTYDPASEISRLNASVAAGARSREVSLVLDAYDYCGRRTSGAISALTGA